MIYTEKTKKALRIMFEAHKDQLDKSGMPYVFHPFTVAEKMTDEDSTCAALLHDVVEDTPLTFADLEREGFGGAVVDALKLLTHKDGVDYFDYVRAAAENPIARAVKRADLMHNSDLSRLDRVTEKDRQRAEKYRAALEILRKYDEN